MKDIKTTKEKLLDAHAVENKFNEEIGSIDKKIKSLNARKKVLAKKVSKNMKYRNRLIDKL